ncbi:hypothetical protein E1295_24415 [Nonomuraea mesophila]|uniref:Uncharacterized protein n=1 Tax=Nonomuraea mesophila TaxID=2530382 RepID=A0A4V2Z9H8_9ACTN|nr:hypothetical protein [Nonomuraea mesophila]TDE45308.1 hypothetical protein E1295_24415 [Nonomuraea mesophila]
MTYGSQQPPFPHPYPPQQHPAPAPPPVVIDVGNDAKAPAVIFEEGMRRFRPAAYLGIKDEGFMVGLV